MESHATNISETLMVAQRIFSVTHISCFANTAENAGMDAKEIRAENLRTLVDEFGSIARLSEAVDTAAAYISQIFSDKHPATVGDKLARKIEAALQKPHGWMDKEHRTTNAEVTGSEQVYAPRAEAHPSNAPELTLADAIKALETAYQRGSLSPQALASLVGLLGSMNPSPPQNVDADTPLPSDKMAALAKLGTPPPQATPKKH